MMKKDNNHRCDPTLSSRFADQELTSQEYEELKLHVGECAACQKAALDNQAISELFKDTFERKLAECEPYHIEEKVLNRIRQKKIPWQIKLKNLMVSEKFFIPATAVVAAFMIFFFSFFTSSPVPNRGPSALVTSLTGDISSVIIIETPQSRQTVIWFEERF